MMNQILGFDTQKQLDAPGIEELDDTVVQVAVRLSGGVSNAIRFSCTPLLSAASLFGACHTAVEVRLLNADYQ